ncbi:MAG: transcriptional regulator [Bryobacter sp.]|jgi:DNA-binding winged helix-turn-helix (wHTH) protein/TolB-like protein|nr:transcriptional regulator [Bryobacter sp.]
MGAQKQFRFASFVVDAASREVRRAGEEEHLRAKEFDLLILLLENHDRLVEREELMRVLWPDAFVEDGTLTQAISQLRKMLDKDPDSANAIRTVPRHGYRFVLPVEVVETEPVLARTGRVWPVTALTLFGIAILAVGGDVWLKAKTARALRVDSLVIQPIENCERTREARQACELVAAAIAEELRTIRDLRVVLGTAHAPSPRATAEKLKVQGALTGSVSQQLPFLHLRLQLWAAGVAAPLWSGEFEFIAEDAPEAAARIRSDVREALGR